MKILHRIFIAIFVSALLPSCSTSDDDGIIVPQPTGESTTYQLSSVAEPGISGTATFIKNSDNSVTIDLMIDGTPANGSHPAHIHNNTAAEGGDIALSLGTVDGATGESTVTVTTLDDGTPISYEELLDFDGYINVHLSEDQLGVIVAQGDIGENELTGESKTYVLNEAAVEGINGTATFEQRKNGEALATLELQNTPEDGMHPAHIHANAAVEGGDIIFSFNPVDGATGMSKTNVAMLDDGTAFMYEDVLDVNGYINVHLSADDLGTIVAQGDIGENELTGETKVYDLNEVAVEGISGTATFAERRNGDALATLQLENTPNGGSHPAHIHANTAVEGGDIIFSFNPVNGTSGMSMTNVTALDDGTAFGYDDVLAVDGYINVHLSADDLGTIVAQGDIGQNELTGESRVYDLNEVAVPGISGTATFEERMNGEALATLQLENTPEGGMHPAHIHANTAAEGGDIIFSFNPVNGTTGMSMTNVAALDDDTAFGYDDVMNVNGYINVHLSAEDLGTIVAQGDIGQNELTGEAVTYNLQETDVPGISGTATFMERRNSTTLISLELTGTPQGGSHPAHIHENDAATGGDIAISLTPVDGDTGMSMTQVGMDDEGNDITYGDLLEYNGYINVHLSADALDVIVAQGDVGANAP
ncbi:MULTISPECIES: CHRD domain-containing protein [Antarcticibacterium]|uniref:CHRD domain-containing protein n=1 Tax=Antarcticibacterium TaxID=2058174 RepID=UPI001C552A54|nr:MULTISPECIES: CHRD domain-containing protein [Antarcticibacterium]